jgi:VWFA-related protein
MSKTIPLLALVVSLAASQQVFRSSTELVEVDVVVLDSTGRLVRGLTAADFELYDEGKRQEVSTFSFVEVDPAVVDAGGTVLAEPGLSSSEIQRAAAVYLIVIDHIYSPPQRSNRIREAARDFVRDHMRPGDLAAVIHLGLSSGGVEFSGSKPQLLAAIDGVRGSAGYSGQNPTPPTATGGTPPAPGAEPAGEPGGKSLAPPGIDADSESFNVDSLERFEEIWEASTAEQAYEMLELATEYVSGYTGRRKSMLLFSSGVPIDMAYIDVELGKRERSARFASAHERLVAMARQSNVAVYAIDTLGLGSDANSAVGPLGGHYEGPPDRNVFSLGGSLAAKSAEDSLRAIALDTGGRAILRYNDMAEPFGQIARDNGSFYLLGFRPESSDSKKFRELKVRVKRDDVQVFARLGYGGEAKRNAKMAATLARAWDGKTVAELLDRPLPGRSFGLSMRASASVVERTATGARALLTVEVEPGAIPANATKLDVGYRAIGADEKAVAARIDATNMQVSPRTRAAIDANGWRYLTTIDLPFGMYQVRVAAREETSGAYGTVFLDLAVPDLARETVAIDSVLIGSSTSGATPTAAPDRALLQTWPVLPTTRRDFSQAETLVAFIQLSTLQVERASVRVEVEGADGRPVSGSTYEVGPESLKTGGAPIAHQVPLSAFAPGEYVLKISVTPPNAPAPAATRAVPFSVRAGA